MGIPTVYMSAIPKGLSDFSPVTMVLPAALISAMLPAQLPILSPERHVQPYAERKLVTDPSTKIGHYVADGR